MSIANAKATGHSADVRMQLTVDGHILPSAQLGPNFLILNSPIDHPSAEAEISLCIDGYERRWTVWLADGIKAEQLETRISRCPGVNGSAAQ
jgi:hypothetical protein